MLDQLIRAIREGGTLETHTLAERLDVSPQLIAAMLDHLQRSGLIEQYMACGDGCQGCSLQASCKKPEQGATRLWQSASRA